MNITDFFAEIKNWFTSDDNKHFGKFKIVNKKLTLAFLQKGQYFRIVGSVFNDGVYIYDESLNLEDEVFDGAIWAMSVPPACIALIAEIQSWSDKNKDVLESPYSSESFGGYTYTKASSGDGSGVMSWQAQFRSRLNKWRKI